MDQNTENIETEVAHFEIEEIHIKNEPIDALSENEQETEEAYNQIDQNVDPFHFLRIQFTPDWQNYEDESGVAENILVPVTGKRKTHTCHICLKEYVDLKSIRRHLLRIHNIEPPKGIALYECADCSEKFSDKSHLDRHTLKHSGLKPHICPKCNKGFSRKEHLTRHTLNVKCDIIKEKKEKGEKMENAKKDNKKVVSSVNESLQNNSKSGSKLLAVLKIENVSTNFPQCRICDKKFVHLTHLRVHMKTHNSVPTKFECPICGKNLTRKTHLNHHIRRLHGDKEPENLPDTSIRGSFPCNLCPKILSDSGSYDKHMSMHSNNQIKKEVCDICSHVFLSKWHVKKHKLHKHNIEPDNGCLACVYCQKKFIDNYYLKRHYTTKHKNEPYPHENPFDVVTKMVEKKDYSHEPIQIKEELAEETEQTEEEYLEDVEEEVY